jgi:hypothetical protein
MPTLAAIISALLEAGLDLTAPEVVDVLWFARHVGTDVQADAENRSDSTFADSRTRSHKTTGAVWKVEEPINSDAKVNVTDPFGEKRRLGIHVPSGGIGAALTPRSGLGMRVPGVAALPEPLKLARALRPLMRRRPSRTAFVLDEIGTVEQIADMRVIIPQMRPAPARWSGRRQSWSSAAFWSAREPFAMCARGG